MDQEARNKQIAQMCDFIEQEAKEKVNEIKLKTDHDFNHEKQMLVHNAKLKIQQDIADKEKKFATEAKVALAKKETEQRVVKMVERERLIQEVKDDATTALKKISSGPNYKAIMTDLIVQGLIRCNEEKVIVQVRECDVGVATSVLDDAVSKYKGLIKDMTGEDVKCEVSVNDGLAPLPPASTGSGVKSCEGGCKLHAYGGRVICDNTLDSRLVVAFADLMPTIRKELFSIRV